MDDIINNQAWRNQKTKIKKHSWQRVFNKMYSINYKSNYKNYQGGESVKLKYIFNAIKASFSTPISIDTRDNLVSYYWLVNFANGVRIPYPILSQEGIDSSPFQYGSIERTLGEKIVIKIQEILLRKHSKKVIKMSEEVFNTLF